MKRWIIFLLLTCLTGCCGDSMAPQPPVAGEKSGEEARPRELAAPAAGMAQSPARAIVIFQGLIAFAADSADTPSLPLTALFIDADKKLPGEALPNVTTKVKDPLNLLAHEPYVAFDNAVISQGCFLGDQNPTSFRLYSHEKNDFETISAYKLCGEVACDPKEMTLQLGSISTPDLELEGLVDKDDLAGCDDAYFKIARAAVADEVLATVEITNAETVAGRLLPHKDKLTYPVFGYKTLVDGLVELPVGTCSDPPGGPQEFAEEVVVSGEPPIIIGRAGQECTITASDAGKQLRMWLFNVNPHSYDPSHTSLPHHEVFYWLYDIAPAACSKSPEKYPRPCETARGSIWPPLGDPKCPIGLLEWGG